MIRDRSMVPKQELHRRTWVATREQIFFQTQGPTNGTADTCLSLRSRCQDREFLKMIHAEASRKDPESFVISIFRMMPGTRCPQRRKPVVCLVQEELPFDPNLPVPAYTCHVCTPLLVYAGVSRTAGLRGPLNGCRTSGDCKGFEWAFGLPGRLTTRLF